MSTIQSTHLTDLELVKEGEWQLKHNDTGMDLHTQIIVLKRFAQYARNERAVYKKIDRNQLELPL